MFGKMKDMYNLQKQAKQIKSDLKKIHVEAEVDGIVVTVSGEMDIVKIDIPDTAMEMGAIRIGRSITEAFGKAKKKAEQIAAEKMKAIMGDMGGMPGLS